LKKIRALELVVQRLLFKRLRMWLGHKLLTVCK